MHLHFMTLTITRTSISKRIRRKDKTTDTFLPTDTQETYTNGQKHTHTRPHSLQLPAMEQREVVADVKHQFPG